MYIEVPGTVGSLKRKDANMGKVTEQDRDDYERGQHDRDSSFFDQTVTDLTGQHPDSDAYYNAREGKDLDAPRK